jgi:phage shock protein E
MFKMIASGFVVLLCASTYLRAEELKHTEDSLKTVKERVSAKKAVLVDVRDLVEWNAGHIKSAIHLPFRELQDKLDKDKVREKIPKDMIVYTYCVVGMRSLKAGNILEKFGYDIRPLKPGYKELLEFGFENEK